MHAMNTGSLVTRIILVSLLVGGGVSIGQSGSADASEQGVEMSSVRHQGKTVQALFAVASTDRSPHIRGVKKYWDTLQPGASFSVSTVRDLYLYTYWKHLSGEHLVILMIYSPDGQLYERRVMPITTDKRSPATRVVPGVDGAVNVQLTRAYGKYDVTTVQLPVAGTWITSHHLLGTWRVDVLLDDASSPLVSRRFELTE